MHRRHAALMVAVILIMFAPWLVRAAYGDPPHITCVAHRGGAGPHTEETAATYAVSMAGEEVEGDIRWTATGFPYLLHNATLGLFGHPDVALADISGATASGYVSATGDRPLSLYAFREQLLPTTARAQLELKTMMTARRWAVLATRLDPIRERVTITSFRPATVRAAQDHGYRTALLSAVGNPTTLAPTLIVEAGALAAGDVARHRAVGVDTQVFTVDTVTGWEAAADTGVRAIITNRPVACETWETAR